MILIRVYTLIVLLLLINLYPSNGIDSLKIDLESSSGYKRMETLLRLGEQYSFINFNQSLRYFLEANSLSKDLNDRESEYSSLSSIAKLYSLKGEYRNALINQEKAINLKKRFLNTQNLSKDYLEYGNILRRLHRFSGAIDNYKKGLSIVKSTIVKRGIYYNLGLAYRSSGKYLEAIESYDSCLSLNNPKDLRFRSMIFNNFGDLYELMGEYNKALNYFNQALDINLKHNFTPSLFTNYINLGSIYKSLGEFNRSGKFLDKALKISGDDPYKLKIVYLNLYGLKNLEGNPKEAMVFYQRYSEMDEKEKQRIYNSSLERVEDQFKQDKLFTDKRLAIEKEQSRSRMVIIISSLSIVIAILFSIVLVFKGGVKRKRLELEKKHSELKSLQSRINPHFLFNALNGVMGVIVVDPHLAEEILQKISNLLRYTLNSADRAWVSLGEEIDITIQFLEIEKMRLGDRLKFDIQIDENLRSYRVVPLIFQPIVENSIKHGISKSRVGGEIKLSINQTEDRISIIVSDRVDISTKQNGGSGFGLHYIKQKLNLVYGNDYSLNYSNDNGFRVEIDIPIKN
jgi:tetratricopeptide (TPR) repeat protein